MQRYFTNNKENNSFILSSDDTYHITKVMRMCKTDKIEVIYDNELYICEIIELEPVVIAIILEKLDTVSELKHSVTIVQSLVKEQKMDFILQKSTELGVSEIIPYNASRSVIKLDGKENKKIERWQKIVKEASEQSKRVDIPVVRHPLSINELCKLDNYDVKLLCTTRENTKNIKNVLSNIDSDVTMLVVVGPEGGFTEEEENKMIEHGFITVSLGSTILRTETVSLFIMSIIRYHDMR